MTTLLGSLLLLILSSCPLPPVAAENAPEPLALESPNGRMRVTFRLGDRSRPDFDVAYRDKTVASGSIGLEFAGSGLLGEGLKVVGTRRQGRDETYEIPVGKASSARDHHNEMVVSLEEEALPTGIS